MQTKDAGSPAGSVRDAIIRKLWRGLDPLRGFPGSLYEYDLQGWNSSHPFLTGTIDELRPSVIVEIGVWKGGSTLSMAKRLKECELNAVVISVDTWLGSWEHWHNEEHFRYLDMMHGRSGLYEKFLGNVVRSGLAEQVVPLPLDSMNACHLLRLLDIHPDMIHLDGCHDYPAVSTDLTLWWSILREGGVFVADDYYDNGAWLEVRKAVDDFLLSNPHVDFQHLGGKCRFKKSSSGARSA